MNRIPVDPCELCCTPVMFARFVCTLLNFSAREFPAKSETQKPRKIIVECTSYATSIVDKYMDTAAVKTSKRFYKTTVPSDMIFTKDNVSTSDEQVEKLTREFNIHHRTCIG